jgi:hypothetical protein
MQTNSIGIHSTRGPESGSSFPFIVAYIGLFVFQRNREHNHYSELKLKCNKFFKYVLTIFYFIFTPIVNIMVDMTVTEVNPYLCIFYALLGMSYSSIIFIVNYLYISSSLSSSAHDFTSDLHSFVSNKTTIIWVENRFEISAFIDKLCGPVIGCYCLDLFSFANYDIFYYISFIFNNYFLLNDLIFNVRVISTDS